MKSLFSFQPEIADAEKQGTGESRLVPLECWVRRSRRTFRFQ